MNIDYSGRLTHYIDLDTKVLLPIYSENYHNINGEWVDYSSFKI